MRDRSVVAIECVAGSSKADEWNSEMLQTGDVVEEVKIGPAAPVRQPFKGGKNVLMKLLHSSFKNGQTSIQVKVRRHGDETKDLQACIVPREPSGRKQYVLRSIRDPNYVVGFVDRLEGECLALQGARNSRVACELGAAKIQDGYVPYNWEKKMSESLPIPNSSCFLSILFLPKAFDTAAARYYSLEDTLARANTWLFSAQTSGVPISFMNVQTEAILTKISGETASTTVNTRSLSDISNLANASLYGFEDYHGVDIGVVKAVRLWYTPLAGELAIDIELQESDSKLGFAISRSEEGFIYISSVIDNDIDNATASTRSGLRDLYKQAKSASKPLVISRVGNEKILPWMVSTSGAIRCFDTISLSQKLSLHRHALKPIRIHVLMWEELPAGFTRAKESTMPPLQLLQVSAPEPVDNEALGKSGGGLERDTGDESFRFQNFSIPSSWL